MTRQTSEVKVIYRRLLSGRGQHLEAFYGCLYYAALRPSEAVMLRESDLHLPAKGLGAGSSWPPPPPAPAPPGPTDGTARQERGLKHRADHETRTIPIPPRTGQTAAAPTSSGTAPPRTGGSSRPPGAASSRTRPTARCGPRPARRPSPPPSAGRRSAAAPTTCGTRQCRCWLNSGVPAHRGCPPGRARRRGPAEDLRALHRRAGRRREQADQRRPRDPGRPARA